MVYEFSRVSDIPGNKPRTRAGFRYLPSSPAAPLPEARDLATRVSRAQSYWNAGEEAVGLVPVVFTSICNVIFAEGRPVLLGDRVHLLRLLDEQWAVLFDKTPVPTQ
jgi:hypothetical protein